MKKILAFLSFVCLATVATAASATWTIDGVSKDGSFINGGIAYLFVGDSTAGVADAIQSGTFNYGAALSSAHTDDEGYSKVTGLGEYSNQTVSMYTVVFDTATVTDDSNFIISPIVSQTFGASGNKTFKFAGSSFTSDWAPVKETTPDDPSIVPEPTTVALLALGLAAFGLKRKIA